MIDEEVPWWTAVGEKQPMASVAFEQGVHVRYDPERHQIVERETGEAVQHVVNPGQALRLLLEWDEYFRSARKKAGR